MIAVLQEFPSDKPDQKAVNYKKRYVKLIRDDNRFMDYFGKKQIFRGIIREHICID